MFARGVLSFHPTPLPASSENSLSPIIPALARVSRKSNHSRTYGVPGGGGCTGFLVRPIPRASKSFVSPACKISVRNSFASPTYAKTGGGGTSSQNSFPRSGLARQFTRKCRRADIPDFPPHISYFFQSHTTAKKAGLKTNATGQGCRGTINRALFSFIPPAGRSARKSLSPLRLRSNPISCQATALGLKLPSGIEAALTRVNTNFGGGQK